MLLRKEFFWHDVRNLISDFKYWFLYRTTQRYHVQDTGLKPGYHETDEVMLHACFQALKDYVEIQCAGMHYIVPDLKRRSHFWQIWQSRRKRDRDAGLAHLDWEISLLFDETYFISKDDPEYGKPSPQSVSASKIKALYLWWEEYVTRKDPYDFDSPEDSAEYKRLCNEAWEKDIAQDKEEDEMFIRLVKIRRCLWT